MEIDNLVELNEDKIISTVYNEYSKLTKFEIQNINQESKNIFEQNTFEPSEKSSEYPSEEPSEYPSKNSIISTTCPSVNYQIKIYSNSKNEIISYEELVYIIVFPVVFCFLLVFYLFYRKRKKRKKMLANDVENPPNFGIVINEIAE